MSLEQYDKSTYIHYGYEYKSRMPDYKKNIKEITNKQPLSNNTESMLYPSSTFNTINNPINVRSQPKGYSDLIYYVKVCGELLSVLDAISTDIMSDGHYFEGPENKVKQAEENFEYNHLTDVYYDWLLDMLIYGNGFLCINAVPTEEIKSLISASLDGYETKEWNDTYFELKQYADEVASKKLTVQLVPASTVSIYSEDIYGNNIKYKQTVGTNSVVFNANEILHIKDINLEGKLWGYSRLYSIRSELQTLAYVKDYFGLYFENNATPDLLFIAKNMKYGTDEYKDFVDQLKELKKPENKRRNLLALSDIDVKELNGLSKDPQFIELIKMLVSTIEMTWQMPPSRLGGSAKAIAEEATLSNQGYYRNISSFQDYIESVVNSQYWTPIFGVKFRFNRNYREDELREVQIMKTMTDISQQLLQLGLIDKKAAVKFLHNKLNLEESDMIKEEKEDSTIPEQQNTVTENTNNLQDIPERYMQKTVKDRELLDEPQLQKRKLNTPKKYKLT